MTSKRSSLGEIWNKTPEQSFPFGGGCVKLSRLLWCSALLVWAGAIPSAVQTAPRAEQSEGITRQQVDEILNELKQIHPDAIPAYGEPWGLDIQRFHACVDAHQFLPEINQDVAEAKSLGIGGTPSFVLGRTRKDNIEGILLVGTMPYASLGAKLRELMSTSH